MLTPPSKRNAKRAVILAYRLSDLEKTVVHEASRASEVQINSARVKLSWALQNDQAQGPCGRGRLDALGVTALTVL